MAETTLIVIPTLNEATHIEKVIEAVSGNGPALDATIVVVDGGSSDGTQQKVREMATKLPQLKLLHNPARRQSAGINLAVDQYGSDAGVLVRCDAHCEYPANYVERLLRSLRLSGADSVVVPMDSEGITCLQRAIAWVSNSIVGTGGSAHRGGTKSGFVDHGHHAAVRIDAFRRAGAYDETFSHNEDAEFDCRLRAVGGRIYLDSDIRLGYRPRETLYDLWRQYFNYGRGRSRTVRKHRGSMRLRQFVVPVHVAITALALSLSVFEPLFLAWPAIYLASLAAFGFTFSLKQRSLCGLLTVPAAVAMHFGWACGFLWGLVTVREPAWKMMEQSTPATP